MAPNLFVDETKRNGLVVVAVVVESNDLDSVRRSLNALKKRGQRRIHFNDESDSRRRLILSRLLEMPLTSRIYVAVGLAEAEARERCLREIVSDAVKLGAGRIVIERDDSVFIHDRRILYESVRKAGVDGKLQYVHLRPYEECLLWAPDAVAWSWAKGGVWRGRVSPIVAEIVDVRPS